MINVEKKEEEPKRIEFKFSLHIKEGKIDDFLGDLKEDLKEENTYVQAPHNEKEEGPPIPTKGGRSFNALGQLARARGMSIVGIKWREDETANKKTKKIDHGLGLVLEFGYGKPDFATDEQAKKWKELSRKVFEDYLWDCIYYEGGNRIALFGMQDVVTRKDGTRNSNDPYKQMFLKGVTQTADEDKSGNSGMKYAWGDKEIFLPF